MATAPAMTPRQVRLMAQQLRPVLTQQPHWRRTNGGALLKLAERFPGSIVANPKRLERFVELCQDNGVRA